MAKTYAQKLKDPRWQKKRLEVLSQDGFKCQLCGDTESTLHVHHLKYTGDPWEAKNGDLMTVCEKCHQLDHLKKSLPDNERQLIELVFSGTGLFIDYSVYTHKELIEFMQLLDKQLIRKRDVIHKMYANG